MQQTHWFSHWGCKHIFSTTEAANTDFQTRGCKQILNHWGCIHRCLSKPEAANVHLQWLLRQKSLKKYFQWEFFFQPLRLQAQISNAEAVDIDFLLLKQKTDFQTRRWKTQIFSYCGCKQSLFLVQHWSCKQIFNNWGCKHTHSDYVGSCDGWRQFSWHISISFAMSEPWA